MPRPYRLQNSFAAGELSPSSWLRDDIEAMHRQGVMEMTNVIADPHGVAESRNGFEFIENIDGEDFCRIFDFNISFIQSFIVVITPNLIKVLDRNGFQLSNNILQNHNFSSGGDDWIALNTTFMDGRALLRSSGGQEALIAQQVLTPEPTFVHQVLVHGVGAEGNNAFEIRVGTTQGANDIFSDFGVGFNYSTSFTPGVALFYFEIRIDSGNLAKDVDSLVLRYVDITQTEVEFPSPYDAQDILELQVELVPGSDVMFLVTRNAEPRQLTLVDGLLWSFDLISFTYGVEGNPWIGFNPGTIAFHDGRMVLGGSRNDPVTLWLSKPREYTNFDTGDIEDQVPDDAMVLPLDKHGNIQWLASNKKLFVGLDTGEHVVFGEGPLAPNDARTEQHSAYGSSRVKAELVNEKLVYIDTQGRAVRAMDYNRDQDGWASENLTFQAEHITEGRLSEVSFGISPIGIIWFTTRDGGLVAASYERDQGTLGWHRHETDGFVLSLAITKEFGVDVPWIAILRNGMLCIERLSLNSHSDSSLTITEIVPTNVFFGYDHLIGREVQVVIDDKVHPNVIVAPNGSITTEYDGLVVTAGLQFIPVIKTLLDKHMFVSGTGDSIDHKKRYSDIFVYLVDSPRPLINGKDPYLRFPSTTMGEREENETGIVGISNDSGWDKENIIEITQPLPLPLRISGVGGKVKGNKL